MIKANQDKEIPAAELAFKPGQLEQVMGYLMFPIDVKGREARAKVENLKAAIHNDEDNLQYIEREHKRLLENLDGYRKELVEVEAALPEEHKPTIERAQTEMEAVAKLAWIEKLSMEGHSLCILTRPGMLKTQLRTGIVDFGGGVKRTEFLAEPVMVPLPQYEMFINLQHLGQKRWANNTGAMAIRLINPDDISKFIGGKVVAHNPRAHWAAGGAGMGYWTALCLGEYEKGFQEASVKGITDLLVEIANYLQTAGDEHAYLPKAEWALRMGNPAYNDHVYRLAKEGETTQQVDERYKRDYKTVHAIQFPEDTKFNPGADGGMVIMDEAAPTTTTRGFRLRNIMMPTGFGIAAYQDNMAIPEPMDDDEDMCDCPALPEDCDCGGECACHEDYVV